MRSQTLGPLRRTTARRKRQAFIRNAAQFILYGLAYVLIASCFVGMFLA